MELRHNEDARRYELWLEAELASFTDYRIDGTRMILPHTFTTPEFRGRGLAAVVVRAALDDARGKGRTVVPSCWFVGEFIRDHPEYRELVDP